MKSMRHWRHLAVSLIAAGPAGGFLFGLMNAGDPDPNPIGRLVYSFMMAAMTPLHGGFPPQNAGGTGPSFNVWPHISVSFLLVFCWLAYRNRKSSRASATQLPREKNTVMAATVSVSSSRSRS